MPESEKMVFRKRALSYVQQHHSSVVRVQQVLDLLFPDTVF